MPTLPARITKPQFFSRRVCCTGGDGPHCVTELGNAVTGGRTFQKPFGLEEAFYKKSSFSEVVGEIATFLF